MNWSAIQLDAKTKGHLIFAINQGQTAVMTQPGPWGSSFDGYCMGLAANWVSLGLQGKNFPIASDLTCENPPWQSTQAQNLSDAVKRVDWADGWKAAMGPFGCVPSGLKAHRDSQATADFLWSIMQQQRGCYGVTLRGTAGAHAIALRHSRDGRCHLFDSNYFHASFADSAAFKTYFDGFMAASKYKDTVGGSTGIVHINPPMTKTG